jgi:hypothetical protein
MVETWYQQFHKLFCIHEDLTGTLAIVQMQIEQIASPLCRSHGFPDIF